jgi:hypothetical protein
MQASTASAPALTTSRHAPWHFSATVRLADDDCTCLVTWVVKRGMQTLASHHGFHVVLDHDLDPETVSKAVTALLTVLYEGCQTTPWDNRVKAARGKHRVVYQPPLG